MFCEHVGIQTYTPGSLFILKKKKNLISPFISKDVIFFLWKNIYDKAC